MRIDYTVCDVLLLAGGMNRRMHGYFKGNLKYGSESFLKRIWNSLYDGTGKMVISVSDSGHVPAGVEEWEKVFDVFHGIGPVAGLLSGLEACSSKYVAVCGCDMPFITKELYLSLFQTGFQGFIQKGYEPKAIIPVSQDGLHPLSGLYSKSATYDLRSSVENGEYSIRKCLPQDHVVFMDISRRPELLRSVTNINTIEEYRGLK